MDIEEELVVDDYEIIEDAFRTEMLQQLMFLLPIIMGQQEHCGSVVEINLITGKCNLYHIVKLIQLPQI